MTNAPRPANDKLSHLYTLVLRADGTFTIKIDNKDVRSGSLIVAEDFLPSVLPPALIDDKSDVKPADWVDEEKIPDPDAVKPADWDEDAPSVIEDEAAVKPAGWLDSESPYIADPAASRPDEWDDEEDGRGEGVCPAHACLKSFTTDCTMPHSSCRGMGSAVRRKPKVLRCSWLR